MPELPHLRIARPTSNLARAAKMYAEGLGLERVGGFEDKDFDGVMLGHKDGAYHLELTQEHGGDAIPSPSPEDLMVFYVPDPKAWLQRCGAMEAAGFKEVEAHNGYWAERGRTFADPDGFRVVIQRDTWPSSGKVEVGESASAASPTPEHSVHAFADDALGTSDATELAHRLRQGELSREEVLEATIARARKVDPKLDAIIEASFSVPVRGGPNSDHAFFAGVPTFIKDMNHVVGMHTRYGSAALHATPPARHNDAVVQEFLDMGMVVMGKSTMPEFGFTCSTEFPTGGQGVEPGGAQAPTRNPWNLGRSVGGSSGGAAALVAAGVVTIAHTADGGGSTRIPAACAGLVGLKATRGRLPHGPMLERQPVEIAIDGVVTRSVRDTARFYAELERSFRHPRLPAIGWVEHASKKRLRIGAFSVSPNGAQIDAATQSTFDATIRLLESLGHRVEPLQDPTHPRMVEDFCNLWSMSGFGVARMGHQMLDPSFDASRLSKFTLGLARDFNKKIHKAPGFLIRLRRSHRAYSEIFRRFDLVVTPTLTHLPPEIGELSMDLEFEELFPKVIRWAGFTPWGNATGGPSISLPMGHDEATNLPVGMCFWADHGQERGLLEIAYELEEAQPWPKITA